MTEPDEDIGNTDSTPEPAALVGVCVADFTRVLAGPYATMMLADLGANVIKIESPWGDDARHWGPPHVGDESTYFLAVNRNKRSIALDLGDREDLALAHRLCSKADVVIHNFMPRSLERFGLTYQSLSATNPALVYCGISGYGERGHASNRPGYDFLAQAESGMMSITGQDADSPIKVGVAISDVLTGLHAAVGILSALHHREATGVGQRVEVNLLSSTLASLVNQASGYLDAGSLPTAQGNRHPSIAPYQVFATSNEPIVVAVGNDAQFSTLCSALGVPELARDPRYGTNKDRVANIDKLEQVLQAILSRRPAEVWISKFEEAGVPCSVINNVAEAFEYATNVGLDPVVGLPLSQGGHTAQVANPISFSETPPHYDLAPPQHDEHGQEIRRFGFARVRSHHAS